MSRCSTKVKTGFDIKLSKVTTDKYLQPRFVQLSSNETNQS